MVGRVIGKGGETIKGLQRKYHTSIQVGSQVRITKPRAKAARRGGADLGQSTEQYNSRFKRSAKGAPRQHLTECIVLACQSGSMLCAVASRQSAVEVAMRCSGRTADKCSALCHAVLCCGTAG